MNKRIIAAVTMLCVVIMIGVFSLCTSIYISDNVAEIAKQLQQSPQADLLKLFEEQWGKYDKILSFYTRHSEIENIGSSVKELDALLKEDEKLFKLECDKIIAAAEHLKNTEIPYLRNIF